MWPVTTFFDLKNNLPVIPWYSKIGFSNKAFGEKDLMLLEEDHGGKLGGGRGMEDVFEGSFGLTDEAGIGVKSWVSGEDGSGGTLGSSGGEHYGPSGELEKNQEDEIIQY